MVDQVRDGRRSRAPGVMYGIGLGGFIDGIVLHQVLQWHHLLSSAEPATSLAGLELNVLADGFFHMLTWGFVAGAMIVTIAQWQQGRLAPSWSFHLGGALAGWGGFNVVEGVVDHHLLRIHHVRDDLGGPLGWDLGFLAFGIVLLVAGLAVQRTQERTAQPRPLS